MLEFEPITAQSEPNTSHKHAFLNPAFQQALAKEFRLEALSLKLSVKGENINIPAFRKQGILSHQLIIGAGFDGTGYFDLPTALSFQEVIGTLTHALQSTKIQQLEIRTQHPLACLIDHSDKYELRAQLDIPCAERFMKFSKSTRRNIRKTFDQGFTSSIDNNQAHLEIFYKLYYQNMHEIGSLPHSKQFFQTLLQNCPDDFFIFVGYMNQEPVVSSWVFINDDEVYGAWSGTHPAYKKNNVFLVMLWSILEYCEQIGCHCYNLGRSSNNTGSFKFKERLANNKSKIYYYQIDTSQPATSHSPIQQTASWLIRHTPPAVMNTLSHHLLHKFY